VATTAFGASNEGGVDLNNSGDTVVVRLTLPVGSFIIFGKTVMSNADGDEQDATARLTTMDGATELDRADIRISGFNNEAQGAQEVSLQAALALTNDSPDRIVDLRAQTYKGNAYEAKLYAIQVDAMKIAD
jgi:hypothetical protein